MPKLDVWHLNGDRFLIDVRGHRMVIDQPVDAGGEDVGPTPTELFVASLGACVGFYAERFLRRHDIGSAGLGVEVEYRMSQDRPSRVAEIGLVVRLPEGFPAERQEALEAVVRHCTVHNTLTSPPDVRLTLGTSVPAAA